MHRLRAHGGCCLSERNVCQMIIPYQSVKSQKISRLKNKNLPMANFTFAIYQTYILPMASGALADCKFLVCRRQMKILPTASVSLADGKIRTG